MERQRVFLLERDRVEAGAAASLIEQCGYVVAKVAHSLEDAMQVQPADIDFALLERDLGDGTDATPVAELFSAAGIPYAFIIRSGDRTDPILFPGARFVRKPLTTAAIEAVLTLGPHEPLPAGTAATDEARRAEIELIKSKLQETAVRAGPEPEQG
jgi:hypothetical protein